MTSRQHARSKRRKGPPTPRTFNAAEGLTGATPEELAKRAAITAAAMAAAERSEARAAKRAELMRQMKAARPPRPSTVPDAEHEPATVRPKAKDAAPRAFKAPAALPAPAAIDEVRPDGPSELRAPQEAGPTEGSEVPPLRPSEKPVNRPPRVFKLPDPGSSPGPTTQAAGHPDAGTGGLADGLSIAEALRAEGRRAARMDEAAASDRKGATSRWPRVRLSTGTGRSSRGPASGTRPDAAPAPGTGSTSARWTVPLLGRKDEEKKAPATDSADKKSPPKPGPSKARSGQGPANKKKAESKRAKKKRANQKAPATPLERRRRIPVALAAMFALAVLATSFPLSSILGQHGQLSAASAQLAQVQHQNKALTQQQEALKSNVAINQLARGNYQMVTPGQTLYVVLPSSKKTTSTSLAPTSGDPGSQPLVAPNNAPDLSPEQVLPTPIPASAADASGTGTSSGATTANVSSATTTPAEPSSYWGRVADTLEFWR